MLTEEQTGIQSAIDEILRKIIDDWYENVSNFYINQERLAADPSLAEEEELKRFHDEKGHRIKFHKDDLDLTYGLRSLWQGEDFVIEVSVNNKVENFDYHDFQERLTAHYERMAHQEVTSPYDLRGHSYQQIFQFRPDLRGAFSVERRADRADIMRLAFHVNQRFLAKLSAHPVAGKELIEAYCVSPFRSCYARVYRRSSS